MEFERPNAIEVLKQEKRWYEEQIQRISAAIRILKGEEIEPKEYSKPSRRRKRKTIQWSVEIDKVFEIHDELNTKEILKKLEENGIIEISDKKLCSNVYSTLMRKIHQKHPVLEKTESGIYRIIKPRRTAPIPKPEDKGEAITN